MPELNFQSNSNVIRLQDRLLPQNLDAEMEILGGCLADPGAIARIADQLLPEAFYSGNHREIYRAMLVLHAANQPVDLMTVYTWLHDRNLLEKVGGKSKLVQLKETPSAVNVDQYAQLVMDKYRRRQLIAIGSEIAQMGADTTQELSELYNAVEQKVFSATQQQQQQTVAKAADIVSSVFADIENRASGQTLPGLVCGFYDLDAMTQGFQRTDLIIVAGRPSMGKTSFTLNLAENIAAQQQVPVLFFSLETSKEKIISRLVSTHSRIEQGRIRLGRITSNEWEPLGHTIAKISGLPLWIDDQANAGVQHLRSTARRVQAEAGQPLGCILIDYLQLMTGNGENRVQELSTITRLLKGLAKEFRVPVLALSQLSRNVESRTNKRPMMSDLRESGAIEQDADLILMLYREEYYNPETPDRGIAEVIISKHRDGPTGTVKLLFESQFTQFRNLARRLNG